LQQQQQNDGEWTNRVLTKFVHTVTVKQCFVFLLRVYGSKKTLYNSGHVTYYYSCTFSVSLIIDHITALAKTTTANGYQSSDDILPVTHSFLSKFR